MTFALTETILLCQNVQPIITTTVEYDGPSVAVMHLI